MFRTALKFILYDKAKSFGALFGIIISVFLIGQQIGIFTFLTNAMSRLVENTSTGLWVVDNKTSNVNALTQVDMRLARQIESIPGVSKVYPIVITGGAAKFANGTSAGVTLIGLQAPAFKGGPRRWIAGGYPDLLSDGAVSVDKFDAKLLGGATMGTMFEVAGKQVRVAAQTSGLRGFGASYVFTTIERARFLGKVPTNKASAFLVDLQAGADTLRVRDQINSTLYNVRAWTSKDFSAVTKETVLSSSGIALSIGTLVVFALISGLVIIGLTLYSAAMDRLKDYATLKAIGATNSYVTRLIMIQALIFGIVGFIVAYLLLEAFRKGIANAGTIFQFSILVKIGLLVVTLVISLFGAVFAIRRIRKIEPAAVFRG